MSASICRRLIWLTSASKRLVGRVSFQVKGGEESKTLARTISAVSFSVCLAEFHIPSGLQIRGERYLSARSSPPLPICFQPSKAASSIATLYLIPERSGGRLGYVRQNGKMEGLRSGGLTPP